MSDRLTCRILDDVTDHAVADITRIYADSIPAAERKPAAWLRDAIRRPDFEVVAAFAGEDVIGFATVFVPHDEPDLALLEYLALDERHRGRGIGAELFRWVVDMLGGGRPLLIEVDTDREPSPLQRERSRRIGFYRRLGCRRIAGLAYVLPLDVMPPPPVMDLMIANPPPALRRDQLARCLAVIYEHVYGKSLTDARIAKMLLDVHDPVTLD